MTTHSRGSAERAVRGGGDRTRKESVCNRRGNNYKGEKETQIIIIKAK